MRTDYLTGVPGVSISRVKNEANELEEAEKKTENFGTKRGRGRPKGATSSTLTEVRAQAADEKRKLRDELTSKINQLRDQLEALELKYRDEMQAAQELLRVAEQRESFFRAALEDRLQMVADHIHKSLIDWADAELEEGQITQRKRGRPRKTFK